MDANLQRGMLENVDMSSAIHQLQVYDFTSIDLSQHCDNFYLSISGRHQ